MKRLNEKIRGFTLMELMVTMILSALVVAMSYFAYDTLFQGYFKYTKVNDQISTHCSMQYYLDRMLQNAEQVIKKKDGVEFESAGNLRKKLVISDNYLLLVNENGVTDTMKIPVKNFCVYWKNDSIVPDNGPVQKIKATVTFSGADHTLIFEKLYDSEKLIQLDSLMGALR